MNQHPRVAPEVFARYPGYLLGVVWVTGADNGPSPDALVAELRDAEAAVRGQVQGNVADHPRIAAWREAYRRFGARPSDYRSSIESLVRRVVKPDALPSINRLVDIGTIASLRHLLPAGVHPVPAQGVPTLRFAADGDTFVPPDGSPTEEPTSGEVVFANGPQVLTRRWTWRQAAGTQTQADTRDVFFNVDGLPPADEAEVHAAMERVAGLVERFCGGRVGNVLLRG